MIMKIDTDNDKEDEISDQELKQYFDPMRNVQEGGSNLENPTRLRTVTITLFEQFAIKMLLLRMLGLPGEYSFSTTQCRRPVVITTFVPCQVIVVHQCLISAH